MNSIPNPLPNNWELVHVLMPPLDIDEWWVITDVMGESSCCHELAPVAYPVDAETHTNLRELEADSGFRATGPEKEPALLRPDGGVCHCSLSNDENGRAASHGLATPSLRLKAFIGFEKALRKGMRPEVAEMLSDLFAKMGDAVEITTDLPGGGKMVQGMARVEADELDTDQLGEMLGHIGVQAFSFDEEGLKPLRGASGKDRRFPIQ
jgi:hypothetical protein